MTTSPSDILLEEANQKKPLTLEDKRTPEKYLNDFDHTLSAPRLSQDIDPALFRNFWRTWELVTTRYKPDGNELRFIYANKIAAEALAQHKTSFPDGAMLAKIAARGEHDPLFDNSLIPGSITRIQIMLKKPKDQKALDGWVYSIYTSIYEGHLKASDREACEACHIAAKSRDDVFSQPFPMAFGLAPATQDKDQPFQDKFRITTVDELKVHVKDVISKYSPQTKNVMLYEMPAFGGTLFEISEIITRLAAAKQGVYIISSPDGEVFSVGIPKSKDCVLRVNSAISQSTNKFQDLYTEDSCNP